MTTREDEVVVGAALIEASLNALRLTGERLSWTERYKIANVIAALSSERDLLVEALTVLVAEFEKFSRYGSPIAMEANEAMNKARAALRE